MPLLWQYPVHRKTTWLEGWSRLTYGLDSTTAWRLVRHLSFQVLTRDWSLFFFVAGGGLGLGNFLRHYLFFSPLGCAWLFFVNNSLFKNCFNMKNRTRVVESTWSFFFFSCTILFSAVCAVKKNFFRNYPTRLSKNNGLSLKLNSSGTRPRWPVRGEWGLWWGDTQYIRNLLSVYVVRHKLILL